MSAPRATDRLLDGRGMKERFRPSFFRMIARDALARFSALFFLMGLGLSAAAIFARPPARTSAETIRILSENVRMPFPRDPEVPWSIYLGAIALVSALPARLLFLRAFFDRSQEVTGLIAD